MDEEWPLHRGFPSLFAIGFTGALVGCASGGSSLAQTLPRGVTLRFNEEFYGFRANNAGDARHFCGSAIAMLGS